MTKEVIDLRSALELLESIPGQMVHTDVEVDPSAELAGVYRYVGAGGTVARPTKTGPAMTFENVKGHPGAKVVIGLLASRKRVGYLLNSKPEKLGFMMRDAVKMPLLQWSLINRKPNVRKSCIWLLTKALISVN